MGRLAIVHRAVPAPRASLGGSGPGCQLAGGHQTTGVHKNHHYMEKGKASLLGTTSNQIPAGHEATPNHASRPSPRHFIGPPTWGQLYDTSHHWHKYRDPHAADLVLHTIAHQLKEAQQAANDESHLQYKEWLKQGEAKGLRGLFRSLKSSELAWERPYRQLPPDERMTQRLHDWGQLWQIRQTDQPHERPSLQEQAKQQAQQLEPLTIGQLAWVLKNLPDKACGPDAVTAQPEECTSPGFATAPQTLPQDGDTGPTADSTTDAHGHHASKNQHQRAPHHAHIPALSSVVQTEETLARPMAKAATSHNGARQSTARRPSLTSSSGETVTPRSSQSQWMLRSNLPDGHVNPL